MLKKQLWKKSGERQPRADVAREARCEEEGAPLQWAPQFYMPHSLFFPFFSESFSVFVACQWALGEEMFEGRAVTELDSTIPETTALPGSLEMLTLG